jgi:hypothetical protein
MGRHAGLYWSRKDKPVANKGLREPGGEVTVFKPGYFYLLIDSIT